VRVLTSPAVGDRPPITKLVAAESGGVGCVAHIPAEASDSHDRQVIASGMALGVELITASSYESALTITHTQYRRRSYVGRPSQHTFR
jgi:hypothetical protein